MEALDSAGVNIEKMRGQGYDGAANMSGKFNGVQARVKERVPTASYVHCKSHQLNLAIVHSSNIPCVRTMMGTVQDIGFAFNYSAKRLLSLQNALENDPIAREQMERRTKLRSLCETRWFSRADALFTFKSAFTAVVSALEILQDNGDDKAGQRLAAVQRFEFIIALVVSEHVLSGTVCLTANLQSKQCDLVEAVREAKVVVQMLKNERTDEAVWDELFEASRQIAESVGVAPTTPRRVGRQIHRANYPVNDAKTYWKIALYYPFLDHLTSELENRLVKNEDQFLAQYLIPSLLDGLMDEVKIRLHEAYRSDIQTQEEFEAEVRRWKVRWSMVPFDEKPATLIDTIDNIPHGLYIQIECIVKIFLTMPVSTATAERSFSAMKRIKTYLRSTMTTDRLSSLAMLHIHREKDIDIPAVIDKFINAKQRRLKYQI